MNIEDFEEVFTRVTDAIKTEISTEENKRVEAIKERIKRHRNEKYDFTNVKEKVDMNTEPEMREISETTLDLFMLYMLMTIFDDDRAMQYLCIAASMRTTTRKVRA